MTQDEAATAAPPSLSTEEGTSGDRARGALEAIRERNEQSIARAKLTEWSVSHNPQGDVRRLIHALGEVLDAHPLSVAADGEEHCPRCGWDAGARVPVNQCHVRQAIMAGIGHAAP